MHTAPIKWYIFDATSTHSWDFVSSDLFPFSCIFINPKLSRTLVLMKSTTSTKRPIATTLSLQPPHPVHIFNQKPGLQLHTLFQPILNFNQNPKLQHWILFQTIESSISIQAHCNQTFLQPMSGAQFQPKPFATNFFFNPSSPQFQPKPKFPIYFLSLSLSLSLSSLVVYGVGTLGYCSTESHHHLCLAPWAWICTETQFLQNSQGSSWTHHFFMSHLPWTKSWWRGLVKSLMSALTSSLHHRPATHSNHYTKQS